ncbi:MAG: hypothetical protein ACLFVU_11185 [Phycisphaerae bacterium]
MSQTKKKFVGFGFGPIQSGLFLFEAYRSGNFDRFTVAEVDQSLVDALRLAGGKYTVNVARPDVIDKFELSGIEMLNPADPAGNADLCRAIAEADEIAVCLPSVEFYDRGGVNSVARTIARGLQLRDQARPTLIYAAENNNHAAEILTETLGKYAPAEIMQQTQVLNTVIGKMSGVIADEPTIGRMNLTTITDTIPRAILVEEFNRILVSEVTLPGTAKGIDVFAEKPDLLPFEEAKLYGHNAIHALMGYLADRKGLDVMAEVGDDEEILALGRKAFLDESGAALIRKHADLGDPLFTPEGYREYAEDLLERMVCPNLNDLVARVTRDHVRKLGWDDRLFGTMRVALVQGVEPKTMAIGAAAGVTSMIRRRDELNQPLPALPENESELTRENLAATLETIWGDQADGDTARKLIDMTFEALDRLR